MFTTPIHWYCTKETGRSQATNKRHNPPSRSNECKSPRDKTHKARLWQGNGEHEVASTWNLLSTPPANTGNGSHEAGQEGRIPDGGAEETKVAGNT